MGKHVIVKHVFSIDEYRVLMVIYAVVYTDVLLKKEFDV